MVPWLWGVRDIVIYGMDSWPDGENAEKLIPGKVPNVPSYKRTVDIQKKMINHYEMDDYLKWMHLENTG